MKKQLKTGPKSNLRRVFKPEFKLRKGYLYAGLGILALFLISISSFTARALLKFATNTFAIGMSYVKVHAFLGYVAMILLIAAATYNFKGLNTDKVKKAFVLVLAILILLSISTHLYFTYTYNLDLSETINVNDKGSLSTTRFMHNHNLKTPLALFSDIFGIDYAHKFDPGNPFYNITPVWITVLATILFIINAILIIILFIKKTHEWPKKGYTLFAALFAITSFVIIKNPVDGGFLNHEFIFSALILYWTIQADGKYKLEFTSSAKFLVKSAIISLILIEVIMFTAYNSIDLGDIVPLLTIIVGLGSIILIGTLLYNRKNIFALGVLVIFILLFTLLMKNNNATQELTYMLQDIPAGNLVFVTSAKNSIQQPIEITNPYSTVYRITSEKDRKVLYYISKYNLNPGFFPLTSFPQDAVFDGYDIAYGNIIAISPTPSDINITNNTYIRNATLIACENKEVCDYHFTLEMKGHLPNPKKLVFNYLAEQGFEKSLVRHFKLIDGRAMTDIEEPTEET